MDFLKDVNKKKQFLFTYVTFGINGMLALSIGSLLPFMEAWGAALSIGRVVTMQNHNSSAELFRLEKLRAFLCFLYGKAAAVML